RQPVGFGRSIATFIPLVNEKKSNFGAGWTLNGLSRLHFAPSTSYVLLTDGRGEAFKFNAHIGNPILDRAVKFKSFGDKKFSNDIRVSSQNGITYVADCNLNQIFQIDSSGNSTVLAG